MQFASPIWLIAFLPWGIAVFYSLRGKPTAASVPFLQLWRGPRISQRIARRLRRPPMFLLLLILAGTLAVFAAAEPGLRRPAPIAAENPRAVDLPRHATAWPRIDAVGDLPDSVRRMIAVYSHLRPAVDSSPHIAITTGDLPAGQPGLELHVTSAPADAPAATAMPHPLTADVRSWPVGTAVKPPVGFDLLVSDAAGAVLAVRDRPDPQVWISGDLDEWSKKTDFVVFFSNAFAWLAGTAAPPGDLQPILAPAPRPTAQIVDLAPGILAVAQCICVAAAALFPCRA